MQSKRAIALRYEKQTDAAPRIVAKGAGAVADAIIATASQHEVPVLENLPLVDALMTLQLDAVIPEDLFEAVAAILAFVYRKNA